MKPSKLEILLGTGFYSGYSPFAPGTAGSLVALAVFLCPGFNSPHVLIPAIVLATFGGVILGNRFEKYYGKDPSIFVLDEFVGTWIALFAVPKSLIIVIVSFILWRFLDILKPFPARRLEQVNGGWGIMLDDIVSGFYSLAIMHILLQMKFFNFLGL